MIRAAFSIMFSNYLPVLTIISGLYKSSIDQLQLNKSSIHWSIAKALSSESSESNSDSSWNDMSFFFLKTWVPPELLTWLTTYFQHTCTCTPLSLSVCLCGSGCHGVGAPWANHHPWANLYIQFPISNSSVYLFSQNTHTHTHTHTHSGFLFPILWSWL
jgi:hypothetical protein